MAHCTEHNNDKLRIRSPEERLQHAQGLREARDIFNALGVPFLIGGGTLLGAYREGAFIPWDWDVSLNVKYEDVRHVSEQLRAAFQDAGFAFDPDQNSEDADGWKLAVSKYGMKYEVLSWRRKGAWRVRRGKRLAPHFFDQATEITFYDEVYPCFGPIEEFLTHHYGDWQTRKRTADKREYNSPAFYEPAPLTERLRKLLGGLLRGQLQR